MTKTNIILNNTTYSIDESSLAPATAELRTHLSTNMAGSGATINLGGTAYNVDYAKLTSATNDFVAHLGKIAGSGAKVTVGGVEYGVDSAKIASAMSGLGAAFGKLENPTPDAPTEERLEGDGAEYYTLAPTALSFRSTAPLNELQEVQINGVTVDPSNYTLEEGSTIVTFPIDYLKTLEKGNYEVTIASNSKTVKGGFNVKAPELNEYGFYYNQPYTAYVDAFGENESVFIREGGEIDIIGTPSGFVSKATYSISDSTITVVSPIAGTLTVSIINGNELLVNELATTFILGSDGVVADEDYIYRIYPNYDVYSVLSVIDNTKSSYALIRSGFDGKPTKLIEGYAFNGCTNLTSITIPNCVELVVNYAFYGCTSLDEVVFENCRVYCEYDAFSDSPLRKGKSIRHSYFKNDYVCDVCGHCDHLHTKTVGKTYEYSGDVVCKDCGETVTKGRYFIPTGATYYVDSTGETLTDGDLFPRAMLKNDKYTYGQYVYTYDSSFWLVETIDKTADEYDDWLQSVNNVRVFMEKTFQNCTNLTSITIPDSVTSIGSAAFSNCTGLTSVTIPDSVTRIGYGAFRGCTGLTSVTIPDSVTSIGSSAFENCTGLTSVTIPDSVTSIGYGAFRGCTSLTSVTIPDSVTSIGVSAFEGCTGLTSVTIPDLAAWCEISFSGAYANPLYYVKNLYLNGTLVTNLVIPDSVTSIGSYAFYNCTGLTSVTIPDSVTSIGDGVFMGCTGLASLVFSGTISQWDAITLGYNWNHNIPATYVQCSDGQVAL